MGDAFSVPFILSCPQPIRARGIIVKYFRFITTSPFLIAKQYIYTCKLNNFNPVLQVYIQTVMDSMNLKKRLHLTITIYLPSKTNGALLNFAPLTNCWFSVSRHSKQMKIKIKIVQYQIKSITWEIKRREIGKVPRQDSGQRNISYTRYPKKCFHKINRDLYGDAMLMPTWMGSNMADGNQQKHLLPSFATKA